MTDPGPRFCPRCGTARVRDMPFCPQCGMNLADTLDAEAPQPTERGEDSPIPTRSDAAAGQPAPSRPVGVSPWAARVPRVGVVVGLVIVALFVFGVLPRIQPGGPPAQPAASPGLGVASGGPSAPVVGLTILSPTDGQAVATKDVVVVGVAPPGVRVTRDVSFGIDSHTTTDGTGHWAIAVGLDKGENKLTFRIGDDKSTAMTIRVTYTPPAGG